MIEFISEVECIFLLSIILVKLLFGANLSEFVGLNKVIIGVLDKAIMCITPLSIVIALSNREDKAVTNAGQENLEFNSGNIADGT